MKIPFSIPVSSFRFSAIDILILLFIVGVLSLIVYVASGWRYEMQPTIEISLELKNLPIYSVNSLVRIFFAYMLSLVFSIWYGYTANRSRLNEKIMVPLLDVLQSIPVLSFLPGLVMSMIAIFPNKRIGVELASVLLIFTGQVWNMAFSYYNSINTMPREFIEVTKIFRHSRFTRFIKLDLPFSAIGLVWNSMMSVAGGWFFLMACEMFILKDRDFRLPGIGSYIQTAAAAGDLKHVFYGIATMILLIVILDIVVWRPLIAWSQKFRIDTVQAEEEIESVVLDFLRKSAFINFLKSLFSKISSEIGMFLTSRKWLIPQIKIPLRFIRMTFTILIALCAVTLIVWAIIKALTLILAIDNAHFLSVVEGAFYSFIRTSSAVILASSWTVPLGVYIGLNPRASKILQPIVQVAASVPATAVFPVILLFLIKLGGGLNIGAIFLMFLGTQWYILFNVIAGASAIPRDLIEAAKLYGVKGLRRWRVLILPGIFPYLITGLITATGGAWNSTIVSEFVTFGGKTMKTAGLGSLINESTISGDFGLLLLSTVVMAAIVVSINRLLWKRLFILAQEKYMLE